MFARSKETEVAVSGLPPLFWNRYKGFRLSQNRVVTNIGSSVSQYRLDATGIHIQILKDFSAIVDDQTAFSWMDSWGLPVDCSRFYRSPGPNHLTLLDGFLLDELLSCAKTVRWILHLLKLIKDRDVVHLRGLMCAWDSESVNALDPDSMGFCCWVRNDPEWLQQLGFQPRNIQFSQSDPIHRLAFETERLAKAKKFAQRLRTKNLPAMTWVTFFPEEEFDWSGVFELRSVTRCPEHPVLFGALYKEFFQTDDSIIEFAALAYVAQILDWMMKDIHPSSVLHFVSGKPVMEPVVRPFGPWEAVKLALYEFAAGSTEVRVCPHPKCGELFLATRKDKVCCGSEKCRKYVTLHKKQKLEV